MAYKRGQILREQGMRAKKHITLDEIGRRLALGNFKELNIIIKGDVDMLKRLLAAGFPIVVEKGYYERDYTGKVGWMGH